ncbi:hypothetical protein OAN94_06060 [Verrucomicrobiales bacterium]|jgi:hypothetical protein|nr:hypothetical protein [Verrucomicrobiales bacterium]MDC0503823.1 hypothetical protein [Verrucomicrobiales bacterium]MDF1785020.1 hypothetical protein [Verrucomicrobiales bacterium]
MISLASGLPVLQIGDRGVSHYSSDWLETSIRSAAAEAGHEKWWFATDIVRSLFLYLRDRFQDTVITVNQLFEKLRLTLTALGFQDIATHLHDQVPPCRISLMQLAVEAETNGFYEFYFFRRLGESLDDAVATGTHLIATNGLRRAIRRLCGAKRWSPSCERLYQDTLTFIRNRTADHHAVRVQIA